MRKSYIAILGYKLAICNAMLQAASTATPPATPSVVGIPWETKFSEFREYILQQPDQNASKGFGYGPYIRKTFDDGQCLQMGLYNWDCFYEIPYKMRGVANWFDTYVPHANFAISDSFRYYVYERYTDPDNGWGFYGASRLSFGACGNRGPQSSCGVTWCVDKDGNSSGYGSQVPIPPGQSPYVDPNSRDNLCPWLHNNGTANYIE
jgi:hypothetical protein